MRRTPESCVQKAITDFLSAKKVLWFRMNAGDRLAEYKGKTYRIRGHAAGTADILALLNLKGQGHGMVADHKGCLYVALPLFIEVKAPGKKQTDEQIEFERMLDEHGHCSYLLADSVDKVIDWFKERNL